MQLYFYFEKAKKSLFAFLIGDAMNKKKLFVFFLLMFLCCFYFVPFNSVKAVAVEGALARVAFDSVGEKVIDGMAEKAGVKLFTKSAREKAVERWNLNVKKQVDSYVASGDVDKANALIDANNQIAKLSNADMIADSNNPAWSKVTLKVGLFLTCADILYDIWNDMKNAQDTQKTLEVLTDFSQGLASGEYALSYGSVGFVLYFDDPKYPNGREVEFTVNGVRRAVSYGMPDITYPYVFYFFIQSGDLYLHKDYYYYTTHSHNVSDTYYGSAKDVSASSDASIDKFTTIPSGSVGADLLPTNNSVLNQLRAPGLQNFTVPSTYPSTVDIRVPTTNTDASVYPDTTPVPWNDVMPEPVFEPSPDPGTDPGKDPGSDTGKDNGSPTTNPDDTVNKWKQLVTTKFPFSLPFDVYNILSCLVAKPTVPEVHINQTFNFLGYQYPFRVDVKFDMFDKYIGFFRTFILISFALFLISKTRTLMGGGQ